MPAGRAAASPTHFAAARHHQRRNCGRQPRAWSRPIRPQPAREWSPSGPNTPEHKRRAKRKPRRIKDPAGQGYREASRLGDKGAINPFSCPLGEGTLVAAAGSLPKAATTPYSTDKYLWFAAAPNHSRFARADMPDAHDARPRASGGLIAPNRYKPASACADRADQCCRSARRARRKSLNTATRLELRNSSG